MKIFRRTVVVPLTLRLRGSKLPIYYFSGYRKHWMRGLKVMASSSRKEPYKLSFIKNHNITSNEIRTK